MPIPNTITVTGTIAPSDEGDTYATHDEQWGVGGHRSVASTAIRNTIPTARRRVGMTVYTADDQATWRLLPAPWTFTDADWVEHGSGAGYGNVLQDPRWRMSVGA